MRRRTAQQRVPATLGDVSRCELAGSMIVEGQTELSDRPQRSDEMVPVHVARPARMGTRFETVAEGFGEHHAAPGGGSTCATLLIPRQTVG